MLAHLAPLAQAKVDASTTRDKRLIHACGACKALHYQEGEGLRLLTPAEEFKVRTEVPKTMERIDWMKLKGSDFGVLTFANE
jgi:hypothetical protein